MGEPRAMERRVRSASERVCRFFRGEGEAASTEARISSANSWVGEIDRAGEGVRIEVSGIWRGGEVRTTRGGDVAIRGGDLSGGEGDGWMDGGLGCLSGLLDGERLGDLVVGTSELLE